MEDLEMYGFVFVSEIMSRQILFCKRYHGYGIRDILSICGTY